MCSNFKKNPTFLAFYVLPGCPWLVNVIYRLVIVRSEWNKLELYFASNFVAALTHGLTRLRPHTGYTSDKRKVWTNLQFEKKISTFHNCTLEANEFHRRSSVLLRQCRQCRWRRRRPCASCTFYACMCANAFTRKSRGKYTQPARGRPPSVSIRINVLGPAMFFRRRVFRPIRNNFPRPGDHLPRRRYRRHRQQHIYKFFPLVFYTSRPGFLRSDTRRRRNAVQQYLFRFYAVRSEPCTKKPRILFCRRRAPRNEFVR